MPRKARRQIPILSTQDAATPAWVFVLTAVLSAGVGAAVTSSIQPHKTAAAVAKPVVQQSPASSPDSSKPATMAVPPPQIVLGLSSDKVALNMGNWSYDAQNWPGAIAYYNEAIRRGIDNADIHTDLGNSYRFNGDNQISLEQYQIAQKENPKHENSLFNQGMVYVVLGKPESALKVWHDYMDKFPHGQHLADARELIAEVKAHAGLTQPAANR